MANAMVATAHRDERSLADIERGQRIRQARVKAGLSSGQFAEAMDLSAGSVSQWEHGHTRPTRDRLKKLCEILNCSPAWIEGRAQESVASVDATRRFVPLFSMKQAANKLPSWDPGDISPETCVQVHETCSALAFAVKIETTAYWPTLSRAAVLVIDPALKDEIQERDVVLATSNGRPELLQALYNEPMSLMIQQTLDLVADPVKREALEEIQKSLREDLFYWSLADGKPLDAAEMAGISIIGPVIQRTEGRAWPTVTKATANHANLSLASLAQSGPTLSQVLQAGTETPNDAVAKKPSD
jgi:transcriptional regulator with XRE-family HTH domain